MYPIIMGLDMIQRTKLFEVKLNAKRIEANKTQEKCHLTMLNTPVSVKTFHRKGNTQPKVETKSRNNNTKQVTEPKPVHPFPKSSNDKKK